VLFGSLSGDTFAQKKKPSKQKKQDKTKIMVDPTKNFLPTRTFASGTVGSYFFPRWVGSTWMHRTVRLIFDDTGKVVRSDTSFAIQKVVNDTAFSLQHLPLLKCETIGFLPGASDSVHSTAYYYVDDSVAMTVVNNSVTHVENRIFLVAPLRDSNAWHEKFDDSVFCVIVSMADSVVTPMRRFDSVLTTVTRRGYSELRKNYVQGFGLVKSVFRAPGPGGHGIVAIMTEMIAIVPAGKKE
jgi:hypothetical protein